MFKKYGDVYDSKVIDKELVDKKIGGWKKKSKQKKKSKDAGGKASIFGEQKHY